jgi:hypothetical protein
MVLRRREWKEVDAPFSEMRLTKGKAGDESVERYSTGYRTPGAWIGRHNDTNGTECRDDDRIEARGDVIGDRTY